MKQNKLIISLLLALTGLPLAAQSLNRLTDSLRYRVETQATLGSGNHSPLWLNANKYGLSSVDAKYGYLRGAVERPLAADDGRRWALG